jgi:hypothetical protein
MKSRVFWKFLSTLGLFLFFIQPTQAAGRPDVTRHEAQVLGGALNMQIEWQSPNPVVRIIISIANIQKEIPIDPYDNKRNRDGYAGEVNFNLNLEGSHSEPFPYVIQLEDELRIKSPLTRGRVKAGQFQSPTILQENPQSNRQIQIPQNLPQVGIPQAGIRPEAQFGGQLGLQPGALPAMISGVPPGGQPGSQQGGAMTVVIAPLIVAEGGAMWRVTYGSWKRSGEVVSDLPVGIHTVEFQEVSGWIKPEDQKVMIEGGQTHTINGFYNNR